jgi:hypothetical protein
VNLEFLVDDEECRRRGIQSLIAAPVYHGGNVVGALELYYRTKQAFTEPDVHTCQLMAGLVSEAFGRMEEVNSRKTLEWERSAVRDALGKLKPNLEVLPERPSGTEFASPPASATPSSVPIGVCRKCGHDLVEEEQFCGECGLPRSTDYEPVSMQSKVALLWQMQEAKKKGTIPTPPKGLSVAAGASEGFDRFPSENPASDFPEAELPELFTLPRSFGESEHYDEELEEPESTTEPEDPAFSAPEIQNDASENQPPTQLAWVRPQEPTDWSSAAAARNFLERFAGRNRHTAFARFLRARRGDIYLAIAVILVFCVIRWGIWSGHSVSATGNPTAAAGHHKPAADLSLFDRMLINLGLAEAPPEPEYKGNPNTQVWVDFQTALYYCPGAGLYGKTPKGRLSTQRDAQLDQFEPASRKACD